MRRQKYFEKTWGCFHRKISGSGVSFEQADVKFQNKLQIVNPTKPLKPPKGQYILGSRRPAVGVLSKDAEESPPTHNNKCAERRPARTETNPYRRFGATVQFRWTWLRIGF